MIVSKEEFTERNWKPEHKYDFFYGLLIYKQQISNCLIFIKCIAFNFSQIQRYFCFCVLTYNHLKLRHLMSSWASVMCKLRKRITIASEVRVYFTVNFKFEEVCFFFKRKIHIPEETEKYTSPVPIPFCYHLFPTVDTDFYRTIYILPMLSERSSLKLF